MAALFGLSQVHYYAPPGCPNLQFRTAIRATFTTPAGKALPGYVVGIERIFSVFRKEGVLTSPGLVRQYTHTVSSQRTVSYQTNSSCAQALRVSRAMAIGVVAPAL